MAWISNPPALAELTPGFPCGAAEAPANLPATPSAPLSAAAEASAEACAIVPGDERGFAELIRRHEAMVFSLALYFLRDAAEAEELAQDVFLTLYQHRQKIESARHLTHWLRQVTCRRCLDRRRRLRSLRAFSNADELGQDWPAVPVVETDPWLARRLRQLLASLPARQRLALLLRYQQDLQPEEIAAVLRLPRATVKSLLRRGLIRLRRRLPPALRPGGNESRNAAEPEAAATDLPNNARGEQP